MAAILWVDEDFDKNIFVEIANTAVPIAENLGSWSALAIAGAGTNPVQFLQVDNVVGHLGILRVPTGTTSGNSTTLFLARDSQAGGPSPSEAIVPMNQFKRMEAWVRVPTITTVSIKLGLGQNINSNVFGTDAFYFNFDPGSSANWQVVTRASSVNTVTDTGVPVVAGAWYRLTMHRKTNNEVKVAVNLPPHRWANEGSDALLRVHGLTSISANIPQVDLSLGAWIRTNAAAARNLDIDRIKVWLDEDALFT